MLYTCVVAISQEAAAIVDLKAWPSLLDTDDVSKRKFNGPYRAPSADTICYLDVSVSTTGMLTSVQVSSNFK